ncbi:cystatin-A-like [Hydractinia symbiolongicarpus]|uniref:cystatin-A-like n=1 Tax=Hydractinia symbiolongicarpus TaxID=13093 RepID=UPI00254B6FA5|nr:cystatin-A-like [Hydractinia symbiolongicarpus]
MSCGGIGKAQPATPEVQNIVDNVKSDVQSKTNQVLDEFTAVSYATQLVAGTNFFIKVRIGLGRFIHIRVYRTLPHAGETLEFSSMQENKNEDDEITYF